MFNYSSLLGPFVLVSWMHRLLDDDRPPSHPASWLLFLDILRVLPHNLDSISEWSKSNSRSKMSGEEQEGVPVFLGWCSLSDNHVALIIFRDQCEFLAGSILGIFRDLALWSRLLQPFKVISFFPALLYPHLSRGKETDPHLLSQKPYFSWGLQGILYIKRGH